MKCSSLLCLLLHTCSCWSNTAPHILRRIPFSNTSNFRSNLLVSLHVSDPYVTTDRTMVVYAFSFVLRHAHLLDNKLFIESSTIHIGYQLLSFPLFLPQPHPPQSAPIPDMRICPLHCLHLQLHASTPRQSISSCHLRQLCIIF